MKQYANSWKWIGALLGAISGFLYWREIGCLTGHCPIQSHWQSMTLWGGTMGFLLTDLLRELVQVIAARTGNVR